MQGRGDRQCAKRCAVCLYMHCLLSKLLRSDRNVPSCSKRCNNYIKQGVLSKRIKPNLVIKYTKSGHTSSGAAPPNSPKC